MVKFSLKKHRSQVARDIHTRRSNAIIYKSVHLKVLYRKPCSARKVWNYQDTKLYSCTSFKDEKI